MRWITVLFVLLIVLIIVAADLNQLPRAVRELYNFPGGDKVGHFVLMGLLSLLVNVSALATFPERGARRTVLFTTLALATLIGLEEASQALFRSRTVSFADLLSSYAGITLFAFLAYLWRSRERKRAGRLRFHAPPAAATPAQSIACREAIRRPDDKKHFRKEILNV